jgi:hypothetical protein
MHGPIPAGASATITITVKWTGNGTVYDSAKVASDQVNSAPASQQTIVFGPPASANGDVPLPGWTYALLGIGLFVLVTFPKRRGQRLTNE